MSHTPSLERNPFRRRYIHCVITSISSIWFFKMDLAFFGKTLWETGPSERFSECCDSLELGGSWSQVMASRLHQSKAKMLLVRAAPSLPSPLPALSSTIPPLLFTRMFLGTCWNSTDTNLPDPSFADLVFRRIRFSFIWECVSAVGMWNHKQKQGTSSLVRSKLLLLLTRCL